MKSIELYNQIATLFPGAAMARVGGEHPYNCLAFPTEVNDEGVQCYALVKVSLPLPHDTKTHTMFNFDEAIAAYSAYQTEIAAKKANKPEKPKKVNEAAEAKRKADDELILNFFRTQAEPGRAYTSSELFAAIGDKFGAQGILAVGAAAKRVAASGAISQSVDKEHNRKNVYSI